MAPRRDLAPPVTSFPIRLFRSLRFARGLFCPRCGHTRVHRWGHVGWRRRYRCLGCRRTFSDFTGTPLAYLKRVDLWPRFCRLALLVPTVRAAATFLGVDPSTSFRWRHRLLDGLRSTERVRLEGRVSVHIDWFARSEKGFRRLNRPPRRSAFAGLSFQTDPVWVTFACDARAWSFGAVITRGRPSPERIQATLHDRIRPGSTLLAGTSWRPVLRDAALRLDLRFDGGPGAHARPDPVEPARVYAARLRRWMRRFYGVATRYLPNYLVWFRLLEVHGRGLALRPTASALLVGAFP